MSAPIQINGPYRVRRHIVHSLLSGLRWALLAMAASAAAGFAGAAIVAGLVHLGITP